MKKLKKGEVKCDKCEGNGLAKKPKIFRDSGGTYITIDMNHTCRKCKGDGKLDWIENIVGKEQGTKSRVLSGFNYINKNI